MILALTRLEAEVIFVRQGGTGNGASWASALGNLHKALEIAKAGDQIWVSKGTYRTSESNDRTKAFVLKPGVALYGGFAGFETSVEQRNPQANISALSGEIGSSSLHDNAFTVVFSKNVGDDTIVDGFHITEGAANGKEGPNFLESRGAGWYNLADGGQSSNPIIRNCTIINNYAREGAGIFNLAMGDGACQPVITHCSFINNKAEQNGGAILNISIAGKCSPEITECLFESNQASYGGGIYNESEGGRVEPVVRFNVFRNNKALVRNGSIHNEYFGQGSCRPVTDGNYFEGNSSLIGKEKNSSASQKGQHDKSNGY